MSNNTQLPAEWKEKITAEANQYAHKKIGDIQTIPVADIRKWEIAADSWEAGATEYAWAALQYIADEQKAVRVTRLALESRSRAMKEYFTKLHQALREKTDLKAKGDNLARTLRRLSLSVQAHPQFTGIMSMEWGDMVESAEQYLAEWKGEREPAPVWVKTTYRLPGWNQPVYWRIGEGPQTKGKTPLSDMFKGGYLENWQWLDESAGEKEVAKCDCTDTFKAAHGECHKCPGKKEVKP